MRRNQRVSHSRKLRPVSGLANPELGPLRVAEEGPKALLKITLGTTISQGWPSPLFVVLLGSNILSISEASPLLDFQISSPNCKSRCGLSQSPFALDPANSVAPRDAHSLGVTNLTSYNLFEMFKPTVRGVTIVLGP
jgi:hypothetical protein